MDYSGQQFEHYQLIAKLGQGGMATVYKAYDTRLERDVAIKVVRKESIPPEQLERILKRFEREAKALAKFIHPNIVPVHDFGEYQGAPFLVMSYLPGGTLKERIGQPLPVQTALNTVIPIAGALGYAHQRGVIHRDVKPSNILTTEDGALMLSDFGIAQILEEATTQLTATGMGVGTPEYMAPEQWQGKATAASDQYALGVVLFELLTGQKPYSAETPLAVALKVMSEPLPRPSDLVPEIPEGVEKVLYKTLARDPQDRYEDMDTCQKALLSIAMNNKNDLDDQENDKRNYYKVNHDCKTDNFTYDGLTDLPTTQKSSFSSNFTEPLEVGSNNEKEQNQSEKYYGKFDWDPDGKFYIDEPDETDSTSENTNSSHNKQSPINRQAFSIIIFLGIAGGFLLLIFARTPIFLIIIGTVGLSFVFVPQLLSKLFEDFKSFLRRLLSK